jgi:voltage-gated potassium channel Kch
MREAQRQALWRYLVYLPTLVGLLVILGGLAEYRVEVNHGNIKTPGDGIWWALVTLTTVGYGELYPTTLAGRIIAAGMMILGIGILGVFTAGTAAFLVRNDLTQYFRLRNLHNHTIICGLGEKGFLLTQAFRDAGQQVVVIEADENNRYIELCRIQGAIVMVGDATQPEALAAARLLYADSLVALCGQDGINARIAAHMSGALQRRSGSALVCAIHIIDPNLWYLLRRWELIATDVVRLQFFNVFDGGAQAMLNAFPPFPVAAALPERPPHLLVIGANQLGQNLVIHAARRWREHAAETPMRVTLLETDSTQAHDFLHLRLAGTEKICTVDVHSIDVRSHAFYQGEFLHDEAKRFSVTAIYICIDDDAAGLSAALALHHRARRHHIPIVVRMNQETGLAELLGNVRAKGQDFEHIQAFTLLDHTCRPDFVLGGTTEALARANHARYCLEQQNKGEDARSNPALVRWEKLSEELKESNRHAAEHIVLQLQEIGCDLVPLWEWNTEFTFTAEEVERMAMMEHARWLTERQAQGWTYGPRDLRKKTNPNLVPWDQLTEESRDFNRAVIRELPASLAHAGFQIYRFTAGQEL